MTTSFLIFSVKIDPIYTDKLTRNIDKNIVYIDNIFYVCAMVYTGEKQGENL